MPTSSNSETVVPLQEGRVDDYTTCTSFLIMLFFTHSLLLFIYCARSASTSNWHDVFDTKRHTHTLCQNNFHSTPSTPKRDTQKSMTIFSRSECVSVTTDFKHKSDSAWWLRQNLFSILCESISGKLNAIFVCIIRNINR